MSMPISINARKSLELLVVNGGEISGRDKHCAARCISDIVGRSDVFGDVQAEKDAKLCRKCRTRSFSVYLPYLS